MADGSSFYGQEGIRRVYALTLEHLPHFRLRCDASFGQSSRYAKGLTMWATVGGQPRAVRGSSLCVIDDRGRIAERREYWDSHSLYGPEQ